MNQPLTLTPDEAAQAELMALRIAAKRAELGQPAGSIWSQYEADREIIRSLTVAAPDVLPIRLPGFFARWRDGCENPADTTAPVVGHDRVGEG